jgi:hypothetical protein
MYLLRQKIGWATIWATFSPTHLVTLFDSHFVQQIETQIEAITFVCASGRGCQIVFSYQKFNFGNIM